MDIHIGHSTVRVACGVVLRAVAVANMALGTMALGTVALGTVALGTVALSTMACGPTVSSPRDGSTGSDARGPDAAIPQDGDVRDGALSDGALVDGASGDAAPPDAGPADALIPLGDGYCPAVAVPAPVADAPLPGETPAGTFETVTAGGFTDDYVYNGAHELKVGTRRQWGGTIIFFGMANGSPGSNSTNTIDANDTGREVQVAFYDPARAMQNCAWNASCESVATQCAFSITFLGWNPVQGGNRCNRGSGVESVDLTSGVMSVTTRPLFWNPNWDFQTCDSSGCDDAQLWSRPSDVRVIQRLRFVRYHVVELDYTLLNLSTLDHASTAQEFPTVYTANGQEGPDLWRLFNSAGTEIAIDTPGNDGFFYENFTSPDGWVTMQRQDLTYGVGMLTESRLSSWQGWQLRSLPFNNFRPIFPFGIPSLGTVRGRSYLILGAQGTVTAEAQWLDGNLPPFGVLDSPGPDEVVSGVVSLHGWALDNRGVAQVELVVDGGTPLPLTYGASRPDVCLAWPTYAGCPNVGYTGSFDTAGLSPCHHLLEIVARDTHGNSRTIARRRVLVSQ